MPPGPPRGHHVLCGVRAHSPWRNAVLRSCFAETAARRRGGRTGELSPPNGIRSVPRDSTPAPILSKPFAPGIQPSVREKGGQMGTRRVSLRVNGVPQEAEVEPRTLLVYFLREGLGLSGTKVGCDTSS